MKVYVILEERQGEYEDFESFVSTDVLLKGFKTFEGAEQYILENEFTSNDTDDNEYWNEYMSADGNTFRFIKYITIQE